MPALPSWLIDPLWDQFAGPDHRIPASRVIAESGAADDQHLGCYGQ